MGPEEVIDIGFTSSRIRSTRIRATYYIPLPQGVQNRKGVIDIQNEDVFYGLLLLVCISKVYSCVIHKDHLIT